MTGASHSVENTNTQLKRYQKKENRFPLLILGKNPFSNTAAILPPMCNISFDNV